MKHNKTIAIGLSILGAAVTLALGITTLNNGIASAIFSHRNEQLNQITLDASNKVTSSGDKIQSTAKGNNVTFTYSGVANSTSGHVTLNANGTLINKDWIRSITSFSCVFNQVGAISAQVSYGGDVWGDSFVLNSGQVYEPGTNPYYIKFTASSTVTISSLTYNYSCVENPDAHEGEESGGEEISYYQKVTNTSQVTEGHYLIVYEVSSTSAKILNGGLLSSGVDVVSNYVTASISDNIIEPSDSVNSAAFEFSSVSGGFSIMSINDYYIYHTGSKNTLNTSSTAQANEIEIDSSYYATISSGTYHIRFNTSTNNGDRFRYYTSDVNVCLYKLVSESSGTSWDKPDSFISGFEISDSVTSFNQNDVFDNANGLVVKSVKNDGTKTTLSRGNGTENYSYVVYNSNDQAIDTSVAFGNTESALYTVVVSYKNFIPSEYIITVNYVKTLTQIEVNSTNTIFNTAQKLSDFTSGISVNFKYHDASSDNNIGYSAFNSYNLTLTLLNPSLVSYSITSLFGTAGTWKIKVESTVFDVYGTLDITVNAIPVTGISVTGASATVEEESQLQLTASVVPNNATVQTVTWSSNHESIATVNTNGLVTGVSAGEARITATATDGSAVYGYIDITVTAKPQQDNFDAEMTAGSNAMTCTIDGNEGVKVGTSKAAGSMTITVGAGTTKLSFYAAGWNGTSTVINLSGATCGTSSFSLTADSGISGSGSAYTLSGTESDYYYETTLTGVTSETDITVSASTRFALWKAKYFTTAVEPVYPTSISLEAGSTSVAIGGTTSVEVSYTPNDTNVKEVTFSSNATSIATVSSEGIITGVSAGSARITATATTASGITSAYVDITVTAIAVTSVSVSPTSASLTAGNTQQLTATISPSNATNKNVTWESDATSVATISSTGLVTAKAEGTATITVKSAADSSKKATCTITVTASGGGSGGGTASSHEVVFKTGSGDGTNMSTSTAESSYIESGGDLINSISSVNKAYASGSNGLKLGTSSASGSITLSIDSTEVDKITVKAKLYNSGKAASLSVNSGTSQSVSSSFSDLEFTIDSTITSISFNASKYIWISGFTVTTKNSTPTDPTSISISPSSFELAPGGTKDLAVNYTPSNANQNKEVTWSRYSGSSNISVSSAGKVTVSSNATAGNTAIIRATLTNISSISATCTVTVVEQAQDDQTILIYLYGSDLESNGQTNANNAAGYASGDISEILKVSGQPDDVNVVIETGGAKCWKATHGINKSYLERYHVANRSLVRDSQVTKANMGLSSTLQSFITWGVQTYPADRISLILWNHGGAMRGVCYDENYSSDCLTNSEVKTAVANSFTSLGRSASDKFEWIGYDACLMQVQDIAEFNSQYFNYMIASEESEAGAGWDYDNWIDDAYAKKDTPTILKAIVDSFITEQGASSDQTLSYLDLSYMAAYKTAWENMSSTIKSMISSYGKSKFQTLMKSCQYYGTDSDSEGYSYFGILDAKDVVNKIRNTSAFSGASTQTSAVLTAFTNLVAYSKAGTQAGNSYGLCCFFPMKDGSGYTCETSSVYTSSQTNFTNWRSIVTTYGD